MLGTWLSKAMGTLVPVATAAALITVGQGETLLPIAPGSGGSYRTPASGEARLAGQTLARPRVEAPAPLNRAVPPPPDEHGPVAVLPGAQVVPPTVREPGRPGVYGFNS